MGRILAIDYGTKRVGLAVTDPLQIIATALTTVPANDAIKYLQDYCIKEAVELIVVGEPTQADGSPSESEKYIQLFLKELNKALPQIPVARADESGTSKMAMRTLIDSGVKKKQRRDKSLLDSVSATLILQTYLDSR